MPRFFMAEVKDYNGKVLITGRDAEHIRVLRLRAGEKITICDGKGTDYNCSLVRSDKDEAEAEIVEVVACRAEPTVFTSVLCGLPKGDKTDFIIQKSVEAGASEIVFFYSERCVAKPETADKKLERWQRIAEEAAKQSGRGMIPQVKWIKKFSEVLSYAAESELPLLMYETGEREKFRSALENSRNVKTAAIITGPEGGFEKSEAEAAKACGIHICSMGERILRCETAPIVALTALMYESGNLD
ncbi:MAG: 16S rRNA (uracil(1498)-N(3))-methyltransferase [Bacillota bacterium]|nr:16S rRNA (uracil(1498)-N(3))-methyltransferase [Bacillota bacterium]